MSPKRPLFIDQVVHEARLKVDEKGTEAAAATAVIMRGRSGANFPVFFHADRPFLFLVRDRETSAILFLGRVSNPGRD